MRGEYTLTLYNKRLKYILTLRRNVTVIRGNGGTGKTTLCSLVRLSAIDGSGVTLKVKSHSEPMQSVEVLVLDTAAFKAGLIGLRSTKTPTIHLIDETEPFIKSTDFARAVSQSGCYFVLITRDDLATIPCSHKEIYQLSQAIDLHTGRKYTTISAMYPEQFYGKMPSTIQIVIEDSNSGSQFFSSVYNENNVIPAGGNSNLVATVDSCKFKMPIVLLDGAAGGFYMPALIELVKRQSACLIVLESFEYAILKSGIFSELLKDIDLDNPDVEAASFLTWERFYTALLCAVTKDRAYCYYSKTHLNKFYLAPSVAERILAVYNLPYSKNLTSGEYTNIFGGN